MLIIGKEFPEGSDFAGGVKSVGRKIAITTKTEIKSSAEDNVLPVMWNKTSPISARAVLLTSETSLEGLDEVVLYFDETSFASAFEASTMEDCERSIDEMILGYQYMAFETLKRFEKKYTFNSNTTGDSSESEEPKPSKLVFVIRNNSSEYDLVHNSAVRNTVSTLSCALVAAASAAFTAFAENIAATFGSKEYVNIVLVKADGAAENYKKDSVLSSWLCSYLDDMDKLKKKPTVKQSSVWVKAGSKSSGLLSFLR